jgi:hypothetical protein
LSRFLATLALTLSTAVSVRPEIPPGRFNLGPVDLLTLATSIPPDGNPAATTQEPVLPRTLRDLHARVEAFLGDDVKSAVEKARWRLAAARRSAATESGTNAYEGNPWGALLAVVIGSISYTTDRDLRDAKACLAFLEGLDRRVRALSGDVPETDEPVAPDLLARWERLSRELRENGSCRGRR